MIVAIRAPLVKLGQIRTMLVALRVPAEDMSHCISLLCCSSAIMLFLRSDLCRHYVAMGKLLIPYCTVQYRLNSAYLH
jgi:hypothetical protein